MKRSLILSTSWILALGCGDALTDASYRGDPVYSVKGQIVAFSGLEGLEDVMLRASLFWNTQSDSSQPPRLVEQSSVSTEVAFPSSFQIQLFQRPEARHLVEANRPYAQGLILIYFDRNEDGRYDEGADVIVGGGFNKGLIYTPTALPPSGLGTASAPAGFSLVLLPIPCRLFDDVIIEIESIEETPLCQPNGACPADFECDNPTGVCLPLEPLELSIIDEVTLGELGCQ